MQKILLLSAALLCAATGFAQAPVSIYEYGQALTSCEANFENLFHNWKPDLVKGAAVMPLRSWAYVDSIGSMAQAEHYADKATQPDALTCAQVNERTDVVDGAHAGYECTLTLLTRREIWLRMGYDHPLTAALAEAEQRSHRALLMQKIMGAKVYKVTIGYLYDEWEHYVFCDPASHKVVADDIFAFQKVQAPTSASIANLPIHSRSQEMIGAALVTTLDTVVCPQLTVPQSDTLWLDSLSDKPYIVVAPTPTIYEAGDSLSSCEVNFKNLFRNWGTRYADNADEVKLLSYSLIDSVSTSQQAAKYAAQFTHPETPKGCLAQQLQVVNGQEQNIVRSRLLVVACKDVAACRTLPVPELWQGQRQLRWKDAALAQAYQAMRRQAEEQRQRTYTAELLRYQAKLSATLLGCKAYKINIRLLREQRDVEVYVFCSATTNKVVADGMFLNFAAR